MGKFFVLTGYFLTGVSVVGLFSFTAVAFENMRSYGFWLAVVAAIVLLVAAIADEFFAEVLGFNEQQYIGLILSIVAILLIGGIIQWVR